MKVMSQQHTLMVIGVLVVICIILCVATFYHHTNQLKTEVEQTFKSRYELIHQFVALQRDRVQVMNNLFLGRYRVGVEPGAGELNVRDYPDLGVWALEREGIAGSLTGAASLPLSAPVEREIHAALAMDAQITPALDLGQELAWLYYQSRNQFVYIAPPIAPEQFHFTPDIYTSGYWLEGGPEQNPGRRIILKGPYQDLAGKGWIVTFAQPVYIRDKFLGMVALDLNVYTLEKLTRVGAATGETMLISEHQRLIARESGFAPEVTLYPPLTPSLSPWDKGEQGDLWLSRWVVEGELWLVHRLTSTQLWQAAARESLGVWFVVTLVTILAIVSLRLQHSLAEVTRLTRVDPLTQALNRRGFFEAAETGIALAKRKGLSLAILMMDIDHFKKINDSYGHAQGDAVLKQLGAYLLKASRPFDVFCRWGGEEFIILIQLDHAADALNVAERIRAQAQRTRVPKDNSPITLSGGLVILGEEEPLEEAINRADELLYQSKQNGRNCITQG
ncbi:sensor domain-containing diguanylate cyclase [Cellvibrio fontiphilus]|uniref:diguanylate cyclase n=1 Tax=Cellvibrio fontiphilus TaxID=1815559 RepID=A0ABV7FJX4_9GAMM